MLREGLAGSLGLYSTLQLGRSFCSHLTLVFTLFARSPAVGSDSSPGALLAPRSSALPGVRVRTEQRLAGGEAAKSQNRETHERGVEQQNALRKAGCLPMGRYRVRTLDTSRRSFLGRCLRRGSVLRSREVF